ncbi:MAG: hypothetical protein ACOX3A_04795 [bacterium]|jgi:hypothetical protein
MTEGEKQKLNANPFTLFLILILLLLSTDTIIASLINSLRTKD